MALQLGSGDFDGGQSLFSSLGSGSGGSGGFLSGIMDMLKGGNGMFSNLLSSLAVGGNLKGLHDANKIQKSQLGILQNQDARAGRVDDTNFANQQFMAQQMGGLAGVTPEELNQVSP